MTVGSLCLYTLELSPCFLLVSSENWLCETVSLRSSCPVWVVLMPSPVLAFAPGLRMSSLSVRQHSTLKCRHTEHSVEYAQNARLDCSRAYVNKVKLTAFRKRLAHHVVSRSHPGARSGPSSDSFIISLSAVKARLRVEIEVGSASNLLSSTSR